MSAGVEPFRVYVDGIWDLFHPGHENLMKQAIDEAEKKSGGRPVHLIVGVCGSGVEEYKRKTIMDLDERCAAVRAHKLVQEVIRDCPIEGLTSKFLHEKDISLVVHGSDFTDEKREYYYGNAIKENKYAEVPYTKGVSTTQLITEAVEDGKFSMTENFTQIDQQELVIRIRERALEELKI